MRYFLTFILLLTAMPVHAQTSRGIRPEVDDTGNVVAVLVSKDIGGERWSIRLGLEGDTIGRITGIVTDPNDASVVPVFAECNLVDSSGGPDVDTLQFVFDCSVGPRCESRVTGSCAPWEHVGTTTVAASFFLPPK